MLTFLISSNQTAYVTNRFIIESGRVISDILEILNTLALESFLITVRYRKSNCFCQSLLLIAILQKFGFDLDFVNWIKTILKNQQSRIIN